MPQDRQDAHGKVGMPYLCEYLSLDKLDHQRYSEYAPAFSDQNSKSSVVLIYCKRMKFLEMNI